jgi:hypothetical protein
MCLQKYARIFLVFTTLAVLAGCGALDAILPSTGTYKINALVNDTPLDDFSVVTSKDKVFPFFEDPVSDDPDITELVVFLKDSRGQPVGYKATYSLIDKDNKDGGEELQEDQEPKPENKDDKKKDEVASGGADKPKETASDGSAADGTDKNEPVAANTDLLDMYEHTINGYEINFPVKSFDKNLPLLPIPANLPIGRYMLVFQVKGNNTILYKFEKPLFYIADAEFSFDGIQVHLPGIAESLQFIQNKNVILLDVHLDFDSRLEPYVVWYNGKKIIEEGLYSEGAGSLFWKAPEQNGFVSISAEVFPSWDKSGLAGYQKGISLLVSSKEVDMHLLSKDTANLVQWYVFEEDLNDSLTKDNDYGELAIEPAEKNQLNWISSNGTYGLAAGTDNTFKLPAVSLKNNEDDNANWQIVSRFKPLDEGEIYSVQFGSADVTAALSVKKPNLILSLTSASKTVSETLKLPNEDDSFVAVSVKFIIQNGILSAKLAFIKPNENFNNQKEPVINPISVAAAVDKDFKVTLGNKQKKPEDNAQTAEDKEPTVSELPVKELPVPKQPFTALWDEIAILRLPEVKIINIKKNTKEAKVEETAAAEIEQPKAPPANITDDASTLPE